MTDNVINFRKEPEPKDLIWVCACGCQSFTLRQDMQAECQQCGVLAVDELGAWKTELPEPPDDVPVVEKSPVKVTVIGDDVLALKRVLATADVDKTCFVAVVQKDGHVTTFGDKVDFQEGIDWVDARLADIRRMVVKPA